MKCEIETSFGDYIRLEIESIRFINQSDIMRMMLKDGRKLLVDTSKKSFRFKEEERGTYYSEFCVGAYHFETEEEAQLKYKKIIEGLKEEQL